MSPALGSSRPGGAGGDGGDGGACEHSSPMKGGVGWRGTPHPATACCWGASISRTPSENASGRVFSGSFSAGPGSVVAGSRCRGGGAPRTSYVTHSSLQQDVSPAVGLFVTL